ncbi:MAG: hypothetical protein IT462_10745 [Planctomycetes bacterium]|nr:hypothetical protein [Planctomycetota bacterium]
MAKKPTNNDPGWVALPGAKPEDIKKAFEQHPPKPASKDEDIGPNAQDSQELNYDPGTAVSEPEPLPAAAKLTDLPLKWLVLTLIVCIGVGYLFQNAEYKHLVNTVREKHLLTDDQQKTVDDVQSVYDQREAVSRQIRKYNELKRKLRDIENGPAPAPPPSPVIRAKDAEKTPAKVDPAKAEPPKAAEPAEPDVDLPLTPEALRAWIKIKAGDNYDAGRKIATMVALAMGGFGLILLALLVRVIGAAVLGGTTLAVTYFTGIEPLYMWIGTGAAALFGALLAPRMLLASIYSNGAVAGMVLGGVALGGGTYLITQNEFQALLGVGVGAAAGALIGIKVARPLYLCAVLANSAGLATWILWLCWGDLYPYFFPATFGGLMIVDAVITRIYHKVRWKH